MSARQMAARRRRRKLALLTAKPEGFRVGKRTEAELLEFIGSRPVIGERRERAA